jgi:hypothetical protein
MMEPSDWLSYSVARLTWLTASEPSLDHCYPDFRIQQHIGINLGHSMHIRAVVCLVRLVSGYGIQLSFA